MSKKIHVTSVHALALSKPATVAIPGEIISVELTANEHPDLKIFSFVPVGQCSECGRDEEVIEAKDYEIRTDLYGLVTLGGTRYSDRAQFFPAWRVNHDGRRPTVKPVRVVIDRVPTDVEFGMQS